MTTIKDIMNRYGISYREALDITRYVERRLGYRETYSKDYFFNHYVVFYVVKDEDVELLDLFYSLPKSERRKIRKEYSPLLPKPNKFKTIVTDWDELMEMLD